MYGVTSAMTQAMLNSTINIGGTSAVTGKLGVVVTIVNVRWLWFVLPVGLCLCGIAFLVLSMIITHKSSTPLWKCSVTALLYHGIDSGIGPRSRLETIPEMNRQANRTRARLSKMGSQRQLLDIYITRRNAWIIQLRLVS